MLPLRKNPASWAIAFTGISLLLAVTSSFSGQPPLFDMVVLHPEQTSSNTTLRTKAGRISSDGKITGEYYPDRLSGSRPFVFSDCHKEDSSRLKPTISVTLEKSLESPGEVPIHGALLLGTNRTQVTGALPTPPGSGEC